MLGVGVLVDEVLQANKLAIDKYGFNERSNEGAVVFGQIVIGGIGRPVHYAVPRLVRLLPVLNIVLMLDRPTIFEPKDFKPDFPARKVVFHMGEHYIAVLKCPIHVCPKLGFGQSF